MGASAWGGDISHPEPLRLQVHSGKLISPAQLVSVKWEDGTISTAAVGNLECLEGGFVNTPSDVKEGDYNFTFDIEEPKGPALVIDRPTQYAHLIGTSVYIVVDRSHPAQAAEIPT